MTPAPAESAARLGGNMDGSIALTDLSEAPDLDALTARLADLGMTPGWIPREQPILWHEPRTAFTPAHWRWEACKAAMDGAGKLIGTDLAERRNLILRNPIAGNDIATTRTLISAYQTILPGETARTHRHSPHALRVILESEGAYSVVNGEKHPMETGDVVLTPGMCWHGHGHDGDAQAYWFDGLDVPLVHLLEPMFVEEHPAGFAPIERVVTESPYRFTWQTTMRGLDRAEADPEGHFGRRIRYDHAEMPTIGITMHRMDGGFRGRGYRSTANSIYVVMQGAGTSTIDGRDIDWSFGDTFVSPCWQPVRHGASEDAVLFQMTDEPLMRWARYWRFEAVD
jgi:gentisate 1,2-dioxygenase